MTKEKKERELKESSKENIKPKTVVKEENEIEKRIRELEREIQMGQQQLNQYQKMMGQLQTRIVGNDGAIVELKKLINQEK